MSSGRMALLAMVSAVLLAAGGFAIYEMHFRDELHAPAALDLAPHPLHEPLYVRRRRVSGIEDEVRVFL